MEGFEKWASNKEMDLVRFSDVFEILKESYTSGRAFGSG